MDELAHLAACLRTARAEVTAAAARAHAHLLKDGERRLDDLLAQGGRDPLQCANKAWWDAHADAEFVRLGEVRQAAQDRVWALERALVDTCLRLAPET
jgi:hypothetical protein